LTREDQPLSPWIFFSAAASLLPCSYHYSPFAKVTGTYI